ncbi:type II toxin-antitoxin system RelE/ParE family toxin [Leptospira sp. GIMC2001]|uniref:type II toxin-antitoxin system RelE/ParE family toxin n=1 Tax=Leptospira sp. GIMC2001 TaxID=1513297 RepID=UPI00300E3ED7
MDEAKEFLLSLEAKLKAKSLRTIELLEELGIELREPFSKKISGKKDLFELRIKHGSNICRFFYFFTQGKIIILTSGFIKKQTKTDADQITKANTLMRQYKNENNHK